MPTSRMTAAEVFERHFLEVRCKLLDIGAALDRIDRAKGNASDPQRRTIDEALGILGSDCPDRAEQVQLLFSRDYDPQWLDDFEAVPTDPEMSS